MREILFRAKRIDNGEWVKGYYCHRGYTGYERPYIIPTYASDFYGIEIDRETLGRYTGLHDKNGVRIFEGDIYHLGDKNILSVVEWYDSGFMGKQIGTLGSREGLVYWKSRIEVIGNIHDKEVHE